MKPLIFVAFLLVDTASTPTHNRRAHTRMSRANVSDTCRLRRHATGKIKSYQVTKAIIDCPFIAFLFVDICQF